MATETKDRILKAFNHLLIHHEFKHISVEMIISESKISKSTFYRHFKDKYEVMNYNYKIRLDAFREIDSLTNWEDVIRYLYTYTNDNIYRIHKCFEYFGENSYYEFLYHSSLENISEKTKKLLNKDELSEYEMFQIGHFCSGMVWMTREWTAGKWDIKPEEAAKCLYEQMPEFTKIEWQTKETNKR